MNTKVAFVSACLTALTMTGCATYDSIRESISPIEEQMASTNPEERAKGVDRACEIAIDSFGFRSEEDRVKRVKLLDSNDALCRVICEVARRGISRRDLDGKNIYPDKANISVLVTAMGMFNTPTEEQIDNILDATKNWEWILDEDKYKDKDGFKDILQAFNNLLMKIEDVDKICQLLKASVSYSRYSSSSYMYEERSGKRVWLPETIRNNLVAKFETKEEVLQLLRTSCSYKKGFPLEDATRKDLYSKYIAKEDKLKNLMLLACNGRLLEDRSNDSYRDIVLNRFSNEKQVLTLFAVCEKFAQDGDISQEKHLELVNEYKQFFGLTKENVNLKNSELICECNERSHAKYHMDDIVDSAVNKMRYPEYTRWYKEWACEKLISLAKKDALSLNGQKVLSKLFVENKVHELFKATQNERDISEEKATELIKLFTDSKCIESLATGSKSFRLRMLAISKLENQKVLAEIVKEVSSCPEDPSCSGQGLFENVVDYADRVKATSITNLQKAALNKLTDPDLLKSLRHHNNTTIKKLVAEKIRELGISSVSDIVATKSYTEELFTMLADVTDQTELQTIVDQSPLRGIRLFAASKIGSDNAVEEAKKQVSTITAKPADGKFVLGDFYLGMSVEDAFALLWANYPEVKPGLYVEGKLLIISIGSEYPCDFSWAEVANMGVYRITFTPDMVRKLVAFKSGSFDDLERAVENHFGVNLGRDRLERRFRWTVWGNERFNRRIVSQRVGTIASVEGETLWFFGGAPEYEKIDMMQVADICEWDISQLSTQKKRIIASQKDVNLTLSYQGAIRLELTKNAAKGIFNASGRFTKSLKGEVKDVINKTIEGNNELKKSKELMKNLQNSMEELPSLTL